MVAQRVRTSTYRPRVIIDVALAHQRDKIYDRHTLVHKRKLAYPRCLYEGWYGGIMSHITKHILHSVSTTTGPRMGCSGRVLAFASNGDRISDGPTRSKLLYRLHYPRPLLVWNPRANRPLRDVREQHKKCALKLIRTYLRESNRGHQGVLSRISPKYRTIIDHSTSDSKKKSQFQGSERNLGLLQKKTRKRLNSTRTNNEVRVCFIIGCPGTYGYALRLE
jgi:hypothetical protein